MPLSRFVVGGEPVFPPLYIFSKNRGQFSDYATSLDDFFKYYTFGAYYSFKLIVQYLRLSGEGYVLLPAYLCPSMILPFKEAGVKYDFYRLKEGLLPDLEDIDRKTSPGLKAVLFVDYFGFPQKDYLASLVESLRSKGIKIIQDTVQAWLDNEDSLYGDYCLNSVRKYSPFEASILLSRDEMRLARNEGSIKTFIHHKRLAQFLRYCHLNYGFIPAETFLKHIDIANRAYHQNEIVSCPWFNVFLLDKIDFNSQGRKRKLVFSTIYNSLSPKLVVGEPLQDVVPLGMPIYLEERNEIKKRLHLLDIHCPVHWYLSDEIDKREHSYCWDLQDHELTLPVNVKLYQLPEYIQKLREVLG
ncbi:MAG TPA: hypothetical protein PL124_12645 [Candidatus Cloacimonadota bacterium]|nr:hypothetical protein [Candidatus Cloacimonadota bacterium]